MVFIKNQLIIGIAMTILLTPYLIKAFKHGLVIGMIMLLFYILIIWAGMFSVKIENKRKINLGSKSSPVILAIFSIFSAIIYSINLTIKIINNEPVNTLNLIFIFIFWILGIAILYIAYIKKA